MVMGRRRATKNVARGCLFGTATAIAVGAQIYAVRELLAILLMLWL